MASKIKVSEKTVKMLRSGTMAGNLAKAKGASPELREALVRFYGEKRVNAAAGPAKPKSTPAAAKRADKVVIHKSFVKGSPRGKTVGNVAEIGKPTGSFGNQLSAGKNYKAPKNYKPLSTGTKLGMAASATPVGRGVAIGKAAVKGKKVIDVVSPFARSAGNELKNMSGGRAAKILADQKAAAKMAKTGAKAAAKKSADAAAKRAATKAAKTAAKAPAKKTAKAVPASAKKAGK